MNGIVLPEKRINEKQQAISELNQIISQQLCTFEEFETRQQKIEALKRTLELQKEKNKKWMEIIEKYDHEFVETKQKVICFNRYRRNQKKIFKFNLVLY